MKIGIALPTGTMVHATFAISLAGMMAVTEGIDVGFINTQSSLIADSRNVCVREAMRTGCDYILFIDSDLSFPMDSLVRLLKAEKDVIGCGYVMRNPPHTFLADKVGDGIVEVNKLPAGLLLIKLSVFDDLAYPWFQTPVINGKIVGEDYYLCQELKVNGKQIYMDADLSKELVHWGSIGFRWNGTGYDALEEA